jgi:predicted DNA binding CopG/RHH family protein
MDTKTVNLRDLPEDLVRRAKACAALRGMTLKQFVVEVVSNAVAEQMPKQVKAK